MCIRDRDYPHLIVLRTFSKAFGLAGLRLGFGVAANTGLVTPLRNIKPTWNLGWMQTAGGIAALGDDVHVARTVAMVVDQVNEVLRINDDIVEAPPAISQSVDSRFIEGIAKINEDLVILLNLSKVLDTSETTMLSSFTSVAA